MDAFLMLLRWLHFLFGITWIGLLYYLNFVQTPAAKPRAPSAGSSYRWRSFGGPSIEAIPSNPISQLYTNRFCAARGTEFCKSRKH